MPKIYCRLHRSGNNAKYKCVSTVVVEHTNDGVAHFHAGKPKGDPNFHTYDFKSERYKKIDGPDGDHYICYKK
ncbi:MAG: hypothetical protein HDR22_02105 [Lachnospiraceae bacterium]|nr:hypothetical protein [Lachnospiraceae bacterium]